MLRESCENTTMYVCLFCHTQSPFVCWLRENPLISSAQIFTNDTVLYYYYLVNARMKILQLNKDFSLFQVRNEEDFLFSVWRCHTENTLISFSRLCQTCAREQKTEPSLKLRIFLQRKYFYHLNTHKIKYLIWSVYSWCDVLPKFSNL